MGKERRVVFVLGFLISIERFFGFGQLGGFIDRILETEVFDGAQALQLVRSLRPDLLVMDVDMPLTNGI